MLRIFIVVTELTLARLQTIPGYFGVKTREPMFSIKRVYVTKHSIVSSHIYLFLFLRLYIHLFSNQNEKYDELLVQ